MNKINSIYCRIFQTCFKIAIPVLPYRKPETISSIDNLPAVLKKEQCSRILLVTDSGIVRVGLHLPVIEILTNEGYQVSVFDKTSVNPTVENVEEASRLYHENGCQGIIALGGGSSMDCAKGVGIRVVRKRTPLSRMKGVLKVLHKLPVLIAIPTTAGTGSECTLAAVISDPENKTKYAIEDFCLIPKYALLDARMTVSLPPFLTATTGMDALTHAIEAYIGRSTTKDTREASLQAISLIYENLFEAYHHGDNLKARENMAHAAYLAGWAFSKSYVGYVHALAHALGGRYGVAHGYANAILLPVVLRGYGTKVYPALKDCAIAAGLADETTDERIAAIRMIESIEEMNNVFDIGSTIEEIKVEDIPELCHHASKEANPLYPVPVLFDEKELERFYLDIVKKESVVWSPVKSKKSFKAKETTLIPERP